MKPTKILFYQWFRFDGTSIILLWNFLFFLQTLTRCGEKKIVDSGIFRFTRLVEVFFGWKKPYMKKFYIFIDLQMCLRLRWIYYPHRKLNQVRWIEIFPLALHLINYNIWPDFINKNKFHPSKIEIIEKNFILFSLLQIIWFETILWHLIIYFNFIFLIHLNLKHLVS